ncbi:MAG TPA: membrane protein insertion efficiency factor YidD [Chthoniobacterales bacterium]|nr:membrane protein insertion efficiency factor YidD [Chthoniobacterales bacterium]
MLRAVPSKIWTSAQNADQQLWSKKWSFIVCKIAIFLIRVYQRTLSRFLSRLGVRCRFHPTCSEYAILALQRFGFRRGTAKAFQRLIRCRPDNFSTCIDFPA